MLRFRLSHAVRNESLVPQNLIHVLYSSPPQKPAVREPQRSALVPHHDRLEIIALFLLSYIYAKPHIQPPMAFVWTILLTEVHLSPLLSLSTSFSSFVCFLLGRVDSLVVQLVSEIRRGWRMRDRFDIRLAHSHLVSVCSLCFSYDAGNIKKSNEV